MHIFLILLISLFHRDGGQHCRSPAFCSPPHIQTRQSTMTGGETHVHWSHFNLDYSSQRNLDTAQQFYYMCLIQSISFPQQPLHLFVFLSFKHFFNLLFFFFFFWVSLRKWKRSSNCCMFPHLPITCICTNVSKVPLRLKVIKLF